MEPATTDAATAARHFPFKTLTLAGAIVVGAVAVLSASDRVDFTPYFGSLPPVPAATLIVVLGLTVLWRLTRSWGFRVYDHTLPGRIRWTAMLWAIPFMATVTLADLILGFPPEMNQPLPLALLFYPIMAIIAQLALHLLPFLLLLPITRLAARPRARNLAMLSAMAGAAGVEILFQILAPAADQSRALGAFVAAQLFAFGLVELLLFRRYDYLTMYAFRLTYYAWWHIIWGYLRLA